MKFYRSSAHLSGLTPVELVTAETIIQDSRFLFEPLTRYCQMLVTRIYPCRLFDPLDTMNVSGIVTVFGAFRIVLCVVLLWVLLWVLLKPKFFFKSKHSIYDVRVPGLPVLLQRISSEL